MPFGRRRSPLSELAVRSVALPSDGRCEKSRPCRLQCGKAQPFRPSGQKEKNHKVFRFGCLPESRRLSAQQAAKPRPLSPTVRRRFSHTFAALWINAGGRLVSSRSRRQEKARFLEKRALGERKRTQATSSSSLASS